MIRVASAGLWLGVGLAKMAALVWFIEGNWRQAGPALLLAWGLAGLACGSGACAAPELRPRRRA